MYINKLLFINYQINFLIYFFLSKTGVINGLVNTDRNVYNPS